MAVFLYAPQNFRNLCVLARTLEVFGQRECFVYDPNRLIRDRYGKSRSREQRVVSAGAFANILWKRVEDPPLFLAESGRRVVATVADRHAHPIAEHRFTSSDILLFGSESSGLPANILDASAAAVTIPSYGQTQSLNLAVAIGIVLFEWHRQTCAADGGRS